jgi:hypothetical protein
MQARATAGDCDLVVKGHVSGDERGYVYDTGAFRSDRSAEPPRTPDALRALIGGATDALTYTCVPPGSGFRIGIDRDADGYADGDERAAGSNPASADSTP